MVRVIHCECGQVVRGKTDDELVASVEEHVRTDHPESSGRCRQRHPGNG